MESESTSTASTTDSMEQSVGGEPGTVNESLRAMFNNAEMSDISFKFPNESEEEKSVLRAHKLILAIRSPVFKAMFYGTLQEVGQDVNIEDISYDIFKTLLRFIYTDKIKLEGDTVIPTLHAAQKYQIPALVNQCQSFLEAAVDSDNACVIFSQAKLFDLKELETNVLRFIEFNTTECLQSDGFLSLSKDNLREVLKNGKFCTSEENLVKATLRWAEEECKRREMDPTGENMRKSLGDSLYLLRAPLLSLETFSSLLVATEVLDEKEQLDLYKYFTLHKFEGGAEKFQKGARFENAPNEVKVQNLYGTMGQRSAGLVCKQKISLKTRFPVKLCQIKLLPFPSKSLDVNFYQYHHMNNSHKTEQGPEIKIIVTEVVGEETSRTIYEGLRMSTNLAPIPLDYIFSADPNSKVQLVVSVSSKCRACGVATAPFYQTVVKEAGLSKYIPKRIMVSNEAADMILQGHSVIDTMTFMKE
ncbi:BTB/POZ domain-containing protein 6-B-like [Saccostrea cucullata]|uniref:BTB/POZ domain-containing protein 6-B-like n=1 Tax=Saccostrea cuccullata TaxID=36930 RepID=UPI002ED3C100